jgi:spermidine/putrescine-binding protein
MCIPKGAGNPVLAHEFLNYMLDEGIAYENFVNWNGYVPPQNGIDADALISDGVIPETLATAVVRPDEFLANQELLQLTIEGEREWDNAWSQFKAG